MATYKSNYTGQQIDEAVGKTSVNATRINQLQEQITGTETDVQELDERVTTLENNSGGSSAEYGVTRETIVLSEDFIKNLYDYKEYVSENPNYVLQEGVDLPFSIDIEFSKPVNVYGFVELYNTRTKKIMVGKIGSYTKQTTAIDELNFYFYYSDTDLKRINDCGYSFYKTQSGYTARVSTQRSVFPCRLNDEIILTYTYGDVHFVVDN